MTNLIQTIASELGRMFRPLNEAVASPEALKDYLEGFRWWPEMEVDSYHSFREALSGIITNIGNVELIINVDVLNEEKCLTVITGIKNLIRDIHSLSTHDLPHLGLPEDVGQKIIFEIFYSYLRNYRPALLSLLEFWEVITLVENDSTDIPYFEKRMEWRNIQNIFSPGSPYDWDNNGGPFKSDLFLQRFHKFAIGLGSYGGLYPIPYPIGKRLFYRPDELDIDPNVWSTHRALHFPFIELPSNNGLIEAGLWIIPSPQLIPQANGNPSTPQSLAIKGLTLVPYGNISQELGKFSLSNTLTLDFHTQGAVDAGVSVFPNDIALSGAGELGFTLMLQQEKRGERGNEPIVLIGKSDSSHLSYEKLSAQLKIEGEAQPGQAISNGDFAFDFTISKGSLVLKGSDGDGFIAKILPDDPLTLNFDLDFGWSAKKGFSTKGGTELEHTFQINKALGPLFVHSMDFALTLADSFIFNAGLSGGVDIGPVHATLQKVGLKAELVFNTPGVLGNADVNIGFKLPSGVGLSLDACGVKGGGFLTLDPPNYFGILSLKFQNNFDLTAIALINTEMPGEQFGFSMLFSILAKFQPIQLGLGFALNGVGGLIGIQRSINEEELRKVFNDHSLDAFLFPENPIRDAARIFTAVSTVFPASEDRHAFGLMALLTWGGSLLTGRLGILIELGGPGKLALIGQIKTALPDEKTALISLHMDILGIIDFGKELISIDASLYDSKILIFSVSGEMALRINYSETHPDFALAVGGFYPGYTPTMEFPVLRRILVQVGNSFADIRFESYFAVTSNSVQVGGKLNLRADFAGIVLSGGCGYDAIISFSPFAFQTLLFVYVKVEYEGANIASIDIRMTLSGPNPFHAVGYAEISLFIFSVKVDFDATFGSKIEEVPTEISPLNLLLKELQDDHNLSFVPPDWSTQDVLLKESVKEAKLLDPHGAIIFSQKTVPLELEMQCYANLAPPPNERYLEVAIASEGIEAISVEGKFAPSQFFKWSDKEKIAAPAFQKFANGKKWGSGFVFSHEMAQETWDFETVTWIDFEEGLTLQGASHIFRQGRAKRDPNHKNYVAVRDLHYTVVNAQTQDGKFVSEILSEGKMTYTEAKQWADRKDSREAVIRSTPFTTAR